MYYASLEEQKCTGIAHVILKNTMALIEMDISKVESSTLWMLKDGGQLL